MKLHMLYLKIYIIITCTLGSMAATFSSAQTAPNVGPPPAAAQTSPFTSFIPKKQTLDTTVQYSYWDAALGGIVINLGPSIRRGERRPHASLGSRRIAGHTSRYRLEGSRVIFSFLKPNHIDEITRYREYLVSIANEQDLQSFSRNEQLAFWFNLHNVMLIETIAKHYPVKHPSKIQIGGAYLHEAKLITINGTALSLRNIREDIVYKNWQNPNVIYGFYLGDIGGPSLLNYAFTGTNVTDVTQDLAVEYVTSLRGFRTTLSARNVSKLYGDTRPYYFTNWPTDLENHLLAHSNPKLAIEITQDKPFRIAKYEYAIADIMGGTKPQNSITPTTGNIGWTSASRNQMTSTAQNRSAQLDRFLVEYDGKIKTMRRRDMLPKNGTVIITDIDTDVEANAVTP